MTEPVTAPRLILPPDEFEAWAVPPEECCDRDTWREIRKKAGDRASALQFVLPACYEEDAEGEDAAQAFPQRQYAALEDSAVYKLPRGCMLVERSVKGETRRGIVAQINLDEVREDGTGAVLLPKDVDEARVNALFERIKDAVLEFNTVVLLYRDKKDRSVKLLAGEDKEKVYDFELTADGGRVKGYFISEPLAFDAFDGMYARSGPSFFAVQDAAYLLAAKRRWELVKKELSEREREYHPARFAVAELINVYGAGVRFTPGYRALRGVEREAFYAYAAERLPVKRENGYLRVEGANRQTALDDAIETFLKRNGGVLVAIGSKRAFKDFLEEEDTAGVVVNVDGEEIVEAWKKGRAVSARAFSFGTEREKRYYLEGKEVSYD